MKKLLTLLLCITMIFAFSVGCGQMDTSGDEPGSDDPQGPDYQEAREEQLAREEEAAAQKDWFTFRPKVSSVFIEEIYGETLVETWFNIVDAALKGEDTFECPDQHTYDWVMGQFADKCFPVLGELIEADYGTPVKDGVAHFSYTTSREEFEEKLAAFEAQVEGIINACVRPEYTDTEKALALYKYFYENYQYDYETNEKMSDDYIDGLCSYRFFKEGKGICQEIAGAYSYLLMQLGVEAATIGGNSRLNDVGHSWSYVRINGENYHIDPTYAICIPGSLEFFMMTDVKRGDEYPKSSFSMGTYESEGFAELDYSAEDEFFSPVWNYYLDSFDHDLHVMHCYFFDDESNVIEVDFDYEGF